MLARALDAEVHLEPDPAALSVRCATPSAPSEAVAELSRAGVALADFSLGQPSLDEVFLALTGRPAEDARRRRRRMSTDHRQPPGRRTSARCTPRSSSTARPPRPSAAARPR